MTDNDEFQWLEDIYGERQLEWVAEQNERTEAMLAGPMFESMQSDILEVLDGAGRIPMPAKRGDYYYNFWRDEANPRGLWRRTTPESYRQDEPDWEILLDVDELCRAEDAEWVFAGAQLRYPDYDRALIRLSPDGGDAVALREFDVPTRQFVPGGFDVPAAKTHASWIDADTLFIASDFGPGTMTTSSYPRQARRWRRGQALGDAEIVIEVPVDQLTAGAAHDHTPGFERDFVYGARDFYTSRTYLLGDSGSAHIEVPDDASIDVHREWLVVRPRSAWDVGGRRYPAGSLLAVDFDDFMAGSRDLTVLFTPDAQTSLQGWAWTRHYLMLTLLHDVSSRVEVLSPDDGWSRAELADAPDLSTITVSGVDDEETDDYWMIVTGFLTPSTLHLGTVGGSAPALKSAPDFFDASDMSVEQHFATSKDGTRVPYFQVSPAGAAGGPVLLSGYGGFENSRVPAYSGTIGRAWLSRGGVYVSANIRGGGEYGPEWHHAALRENRPRAYEDFAAVADDLVARGVTTPERLGCEGRSNGGLLVGNMLTTYPQLFGAISCGVPLLDMKRYTKLSAGTSWIAEYGDPDVPEDWEFIRGFSPYHNLHAGTDYPPTLFYTVTSDDRVGPVQARKMAARMQALGVPNVWVYENREGGHGGGSDNKQMAHYLAASYTFLFDTLNGSTQAAR
ncbi:prolyl oligopeptidase family serine peptidase [Spelaeicoccus albus]|uniref:Prolyl oligopeptidase n=1 Tax=Spelaeicoccus albus TaxID=1280376 RepID=A0A7Z0CZS3_9MICO|nr:prolyl oligopeptidase family serine peptidase [Spelaeicoccus albus]NYI66626.1 prolyl oligopeptidase [Spelaeicoccus albus]